VIDAAMFGRRVHVLVFDEAEARRDLPALLAARGVALRGLTRVEPALEDVFVDLVRQGGGAPAQ
jgi:hypothetical protein